MDESDLLWGADVLIKLQRATPRHPGDKLDDFVNMGELMLGIASILPMHDAHGLSSSQRRVVAAVISAMQPTAHTLQASHSPHARPTRPAALPGARLRGIRQGAGVCAFRKVLAR